MEGNLKTAVLAYLIESLQPLGKTQIQKSIYFVQEAKHVPLNFDFIMYHYGPYSKDIEQMLTIMNATGEISITAYPHGDWNGFEIKRIKPEAIVIPDDVKKKVDEVINILKNFDTSKTELCATLHFVYSILKDRNQDASKERISKEVKNLKPKFSDEEILDCYKKLTDANLLSLA